MIYIVVQTSKPKRYLAHSVMLIYWSTDREAAMHYYKKEVAEALAHNMGGIVVEL